MTGLVARTVLACGLLTSGALALPSTASAQTVTFRACNHTDDIAMVASSYIPLGGSDWRNMGWTSVDPGQCKDIFETANGIFYARAEVKDDPDSFWGSDINQCVEYPGPYDFYTTSEQTDCPEGEAAMFTEFHSNGSPVFVWNLNPSD
ncbi:MAG: DUF1036 domain-containing protein [Proteobacteria bacterium]|nr:DUF1036 domain-containing protein [Pseudomonadota bacterium]